MVHSFHKAPSTTVCTATQNTLPSLGSTSTTYVELEVEVLLLLCILLLQYYILLILL